MNGGLKQQSKVDARVGEVVKRLRQDKGKTGAEIAQAVGLSQSSLCRLENGMQQWTLDSLTRVALVLGARPSQVLAKARM